MIENIRLSIKGIWGHKMRSFLTMLGIIIGIAAIIAIVSTIKGTNKQIEDNLIGDGTNTVQVQLYIDGWVQDFSYQEVPNGVPAFNEDIKKQIVDISGAENVSMYHKRDYCDNMYYGSMSLSSISVFGIDSSHFETKGLEIVEGRGISQNDLKSSRKVVVIDKTTAANIDDGGSLIGKNIDISGEPYEIIGVVEKKSEFEPVINSVEDYYTYKQDENGAVYIPDSTWPIVFRYDEPCHFIVKAGSTKEMTSVGKATADLLNGYLNVEDGKKVEYKATDLAQAATQIQQLASSTNIMLIGIASISLLVGGIGVMNIMLVSVTERTREIGLKKALGAKRRTIRAQFLTEAAMISIIGGILGVIFGIILSHIISAFAQVPVAISIPAIFVSVGFSVIIGIIFGLMPSIKASNLNPIDALRYE